MKNSHNILRTKKMQLFEDYSKNNKERLIAAASNSNVNL